MRRLVFPTPWPPTIRTRSSPTGLVFRSGMRKPLSIQLALVSSGVLSTILSISRRKRASSSEKITELIVYVGEVADGGGQKGVETKEEMEGWC